MENYNKSRRLNSIRQVVDLNSSVGSPLQSSGVKMLNLFWVNQRLDAVIGELAKNKNRDVEITQASQLIDIARSLLKSYSDKLRDE